MFAIIIDHQQVTRVDAIDSLTLPPKQGVVWLHLEGPLDITRQWLDAHFNVDRDTADALCNELTRPRLFVNADEDLVLTLRALRSDRDNHPQMVSIRALISDSVLLTLSYVGIPAVSNLAQRLTSKGRYKGIRSTHPIVEKLCDEVSEQLTAHITEQDEQLSELEDAWENHHTLNADTLHQLRLNTSRVGRYLMPQLEAFSRLNGVLEERIPNKDRQSHIARWRELVNALKRDLEAVTEIRERVTILRDAIQQRADETSNRIMYLLSMIATFFLPLTFIASLLGMNVGGLPVQDKHWAFWAVCGFMLILAVIQWRLFKRWRWLN